MFIKIVNLLYIKLEYDIKHRGEGLQTYKKDWLRGIWISFPSH